MAAFAGEEICWDCLSKGELYRFEGVGDPHPEWKIDFYEAISVTILFGVIEGGGGLGYLPGGEPVPIDPEWWFQIATYTDSRDLAAQIDRLGDSLDSHRIRFSEVSDVADTLRLDDTVAIVTPRSEADALAFIKANSEAMIGLDHPTIVFLQEGGEVVKEIELVH